MFLNLLRFKSPEKGWTFHTVYAMDRVKEKIMIR